MDGEKMFSRAYEIAADLIQEGEAPFSVAAVFVLVGLQMYRSSMNEEDYNRMVDSISKSRNEVKSFFDQDKHRNLLN